jgi:hypothetical protein
VATGVLASSLAGERSPRGGFLFTAGLLHDVGKTVFANNYPVEASKMYEESRLWESLREADLGAVEQLAFGLDHREVGEYVARKMQFPENLTEVLRHHASPSILPLDHPTHRPSWIVHMASVAATGLGYAAGSPVSWDDCRRDSRWRQTLEARLVPHANEDILFASCEDAVRDIDSLLRLSTDPEALFMKSVKRTKRANREPVGGERSSGLNSGTQGESTQTHNTIPD